MVSNPRIPAIQGLRGIAVLAVILFHADGTLLPGGYLGVDLFFLISGYVVTGSILRNNKFSFSRFYARRFHRLAPPAALTVLVTVAAYYVLAPALVSQNFVLGALSSLIGVSNIFFSLSDGYWSSELQTNPFLHFWSLSVEEQFYLLWPFLIIVVFKLQTGCLLRKLSAIALISLAIFIATETAYPGSSFFGTHARTFQFSVGALAFAFSRKTASEHLLTIAFTIGVAGTLASILYIDEHTLYPAARVLLPTSFFFLLIMSTHSKVGKALFGNSGLVFLGGVSYSLYLVHWPVTVIAKTFLGAGSLAVISVLGLSLLAGVLLWWAVESRCQSIFLNGDNTNSQGRWARETNYGLTIGSLVVVTVALLFTAAENEIDTIAATAGLGFAARVDSEVRMAGPVLNPKKEMWRCQTYEKGRQMGNDKYKLFEDLDADLCMSGDFLVIGDSVGPSVVFSLLSIYGGDNLAILNSAGCTVDPFYKNTGAPDCVQINNFRTDYSFLGEFASVYVASAHMDYMPETRYRKLIEYFSKAPTDIYLISNFPLFTRPVPEILSVVAGSSQSSFDLANFVKPRQMSVARAKEISDMYNNIHFVDVMPAFRNSGRIPAYSPNGHPIWRDSRHFNPAGDEILDKYLRSTLRPQQ